jgi:hypothetical protein
MLVPSLAAIQCCGFAERVLQPAGCAMTVLWPRCERVVGGKTLSLSQLSQFIVCVHVSIMSLLTELVS